MEDEKHRSRLNTFCDVENALECRLDRTREDALDCFRLAVVPILKRIGWIDPQDGVFISFTEDIRRLPRYRDHRSYVTHLPQEMYMVRGNGTVEHVERREGEDYFGLCIAKYTYPRAVLPKPGDVPVRVLAVLLDRLEKGEFIFEPPRALISIEGPSI